MAKTILVTGASSGIGHALCDHLLSTTDHRVIGIDRKAQEFFSNQPQYGHFCCNLLDFDATQRVIEEIGLGKTSLDVLVNCAGMMPTSLISKLDPQEALDAFSLNCVVPLFLAKLLFKALVRSTQPSIINITSIAADLDIPGEVVYGATKAALTHASRSMATELGRFGISVNCVAPPLVITPMTAHLTDSQRQYMHKKQSYKERVTSKDVAVVIAQLIDGPATITGSTLYAGGIAR